ncbi:unnamed protein product [Fraxinus pennsylvanica]|uniref:DUF7734 domain-containing protein n=1 Tax=Fraxinus pennsylvanica TaxID=56036 RepID=A0AAD1YQ57_9LAMI|nr:unnamed protein product [Fraxinus pennsylvanica]
MLKRSGIWTALTFPHLLPPSSINHRVQCSARRRALFDDEEYEQNEEIGLLETYTQYMKDEVLLVKAMVDGEEAEVLVFKGFSSCLSYKTSADTSRSVIPARAVIKTIDRIKGPFDPSNIQFIEKGLTLEAFKSRLRSDGQF